MFANKFSKGNCPTAGHAVALLQGNWPSAGHAIALNCPSAGQLPICRVVVIVVVAVVDC
jgi:hypothetical protein